MKLLRDRNERPLLLLALAALILLILVEIKIQLLPFFQNTIIDSLLTSQNIQNILSDLLIGLLSAYIFYLLVDYLPRSRKEQKIMDVLNALIASILDAYNRSRIFGHETALPYVDKAVLSEDWLNQHIALFMKDKSLYLPLIFAMQTADSRIDDFRNALPLAVSLSPERAMQWLVIIDKVRLLAENYGQNPKVPEDKLHLLDSNSDDNPAKLYKSTLNLRTLEITEAARDWLYPKQN